jgi:hypothetical protein
MEKIRRDVLQKILVDKRDYINRSAQYTQARWDRGRLGEIVWELSGPLDASCSETAEVPYIVKMRNTGYLKECRCAVCAGAAAL